MLLVMKSLNILAAYHHVVMTLQVRLIDSPNKTRRLEFNIADEERGGDSIAVKFWGDKTINEHVDKLHTGKKVEVENLNVNVFEGRTRTFISLNSSLETSVTLLDQVEVKETVMIDGMNIDER